MSSLSLFAQVNLAGGYAWIFSSPHLSRVAKLLQPRIEEAFVNKADALCEMEFEGGHRLLAQILYCPHDYDDTDRKGLVLVFGCIADQVSMTPSAVWLQNGAQAVLQMRRQLMQFSIARENASAILTSLLIAIVQLRQDTSASVTDLPQIAVATRRGNRHSFKRWMTISLIMQMIVAVTLVAILILLAIQLWIDLTGPFISSV